MTLPIGAALADDVAAVLRAAEAIPLPPPALPGWQGLCAEEYASASGRLHERYRFALAAMQQAVLVARLGLPG